jgi:V/A-type H+-transporting ATPase subunit E
MTTAAIVADIERETASEVDALLAEADARAAGIVAAARADLRLAVDHARARAEPQARLDAARRVNAARLRLLERRADLATERCEAVFEAAARGLEAIAGGADPDRWARALGRLTDESLALTGPGATIVVRTADLPLVERRVTTAGAVAASTPDADPGVLATSSDGRIEVDARLASRLERARIRLAEAVAVGLGLGG